MDDRFHDCYRILVQDIEIDCFLGVYDREQARLRPIVIDVELYVPDTTRAPRRDLLAETVNYERVVETVERTAQRTSAERASAAAVRSRLRLRGLVRRKPGGELASAEALAALIAYSRLRVDAHSPSEALAGMALGSLASALALSAGRLPHSRPPLWLGAGLLLWMLSLPLGAPPSPTHGWVVRLSLALSDRAEPYSRDAMHRDYRRESQRRSTAQASTRLTVPPR